MDIKRLFHNSPDTMKLDDMSIFRSSTKEYLQLKTCSIQGWKLPIDQELGRTIIAKELVKMVAAGGLLCLQEQPMKFWKERNKAGEEIIKSGPKEVNLWRFDRISFQTSLELVDYFGFLKPNDSIHANLISSRYNCEPSGKVTKVKTLICEISTRIPIAITEIHFEYLALAPLNITNWPSVVKTVMDFNEKEMNQDYSEWERKDLKRIFVSSGRVIVGG